MQKYCHFISSRICIFKLFFLNWSRQNVTTVLATNHIWFTDPLIYCTCAPNVDGSYCVKHLSFKRSILPLQSHSKFTVVYSHLSGLSIILNACIFGIQTKLSLDAASMSIVHLFCWFWTTVSDASLLILHRLWSVSNKYSFGLVAYCLSLSFFSLFLYNTADLNSFKPKALISKWTSSGPNDLVKNIFYGSEWSNHL